MKIRKIVSVLLALIVVGVPVATPMFADTAAQGASSARSETADKNETIYAMLGHDGSADVIYVVNQLIGDYTDYGKYSEIKNLSTSSEPVISGDLIKFADAEVEGGLYYQGRMDGELPMTFDFRYYLDGEAVDAASLGGASGHLKINIGCAPNERCDERIREGLMAQIVLSLDTRRAGRVAADGATTVIAGNTMNIAFAVLPGESGAFTVEADVTDFEMDAVRITLMQSNLGGYGDSIGEYEEGFDDMLSGADDMVDGTTELKDGMATLADGIGDLSSGLSRLSSGGSDMLCGMRQYGDGLREYTQGVSGMVSASQSVRAGLNELSDNGMALADSLAQISGSVESMASNAELYTLAQSLSASSDPAVQALANSTLALLDGMRGVSGGLSEVSSGVGGYAAGVQQAASGYDEFDAGLSRLASGGDSLASGYEGIVSGFEAFASGVSSSASGAKRIYKAVDDLPDDIQKLIDGQLEFRDGISTAREDLLEQTDGLSGAAPVSFASPDRNHPQSVQYIFMTPSINKPEAETQTKDTEAEDSFFDRLRDLFG
jgi:X-X-X-Leu-X-X-Gly heptad repeat protein